MADEPLPASYPLKLLRGDTRVWQVTLEQNTGTEEAPVWVALDLTGHTFLATVRAARSRDATVLATIDVQVEGDPTDGVVELTLTSVEADGLVLPSGEQGPAWWDLQVTRTSDTFVRTYLSGKVTLVADVAHG